MDAGWVTLACIDDDLIDISMESVCRKVDQLADSFPVIVLLGALDTDCVGTSVLNSQDASA